MSEKARRFKLSAQCRHWLANHFIHAVHSPFTKLNPLCHRQWLVGCHSSSPSTLYSDTEAYRLHWRTSSLFYFFQLDRQTWLLKKKVTFFCYFLSSHPPLTHSYTSPHDLSLSWSIPLPPSLSHPSVSLRSCWLVSLASIASTHQEEPPSPCRPPTAPLLTPALICFTWLSLNTSSVSRWIQQQHLLPSAEASPPSVSPGRDSVECFERSERGRQAMGGGRGRGGIFPGVSSHQLC